MNATSNYGETQLQSFLQNNYKAAQLSRAFFLIKKVLSSSRNTGLDTAQVKMDLLGNPLQDSLSHIETGYQELRLSSKCLSDWGVIRIYFEIAFSKNRNIK